jgi:hypothetical protein
MTLRKYPEPKPIVELSFCNNSYEDERFRVLFLVQLFTWMTFLRFFTASAFLPGTNDGDLDI